jgi:hypothetical protein
MQEQQLFYTLTSAVTHPKKTQSPFRLHWRVHIIPQNAHIVKYSSNFLGILRDQLIQANCRHIRNLYPSPVFL